MPTARVDLTEEEVAALDAAVAAGRYANRSAALRAGVGHVLQEERERSIAEDYARGYAEHPQESWIGEAGLAALAAFESASDCP
jgi:Arc/MetJ-type ribon-helix-helix transcriptional regulator